MRVFLAVVLMSALAGSCKYGIADINGVPDNPTYNKDIYPLLRDHCLLCHGATPNRGAPSTIRLDTYQGAVDWVNSMMNDMDNDRMPPAAKDGDGVGPNGKAMLHKWVENGTPE